jgi:hypothetical protein
VASDHTISQKLPAQQPDGGSGIFCSVRDSDAASIAIDSDLPGSRVIRQNNRIVFSHLGAI